MPRWYFESLSVARRIILRGKLSQRAAACLVALALGGWAHGAGLGRLTVQSRLGQPFAAEIEVLNVSRDDYATLTVKLAPSLAYQAANLAFDPALNSLRVSVQRRADGTPYIRATSWRSVTEPYLDLLIDVGSNDGGFRRHYAVLLDLPNATDTVAAPAGKPDAPAGTTESAGASKPAERRARKPAASVNAPPAPIPPRAPPSTQTPPTAASVPPARAKISALKLDPTFFELPGAAAKREPTAPEAPKVEAAPAVVTVAPVAPLASNAPTVAPEPPKPPKQNPDPPSANPAPVPQAAAPNSSVRPAPRSQPAASVASPFSAASSPSSGKEATGPSVLRIAGLVLIGVAVALGLWAGFAAWRRRQTAEEETYTYMNAADEPVDGSTPPQEASATSPTGARDAAAPAAADTVSSVTGMVDPLDEAKVYLNYNQLDQAEKTLRNGLSHAPGREDIAVALLELLAVRDDKEAFNQFAARLHRQTGGIGDAWKRVTGLGYAIDPSHPLYSPPTDTTDAALLTFTTPQEEASNRAAPNAQPEAAIAVDSAAYSALRRLGIEPVSVEAAAPAFTIDLPPSDATAGVKGTGAGLVDPAMSPSAGSDTGLNASDSGGLDFRIDLPEANASSQSGPDLTTIPGDTSIDFKLDDAGDNVTADPVASFWDSAVTTPPSNRSGKAQGPIVRPWQVAARDEKWVAVQEKLELASAYIAMNDLDAAKEVLNEIQADGDGEQQAEARRLTQTIT